MRYEPDQPKPELNEKGKVELIDILKESSKWAISLDTVPTSVKGVTLGWVWSEHAEYGFGVNLRWKVYFDRKPNQEEISFVSDSASELLSSDNKHIKNRPQKAWAGLAKNARLLCGRYEYMEQ